MSGGTVGDLTDNNFTPDSNSVTIEDVGFSSRAVVLVTSRALGPDSFRLEFDGGHERKTHDFIDPGTSTSLSQDHDGFTLTKNRKATVRLFSLPDQPVLFDTDVPQAETIDIWAKAWDVTDAQDLTGDVPYLSGYTQGVSWRWIRVDSDGSSTSTARDPGNSGRLRPTSARSSRSR